MQPNSGRQETRLATLVHVPSVDASTAWHVIGSVLIVLLAIALSHRLRRTTIDLVRRRSRLDAAGSLLAGRLVSIVTLAVAALWILNLWGSGITPLLTLLGVVGLAVSLALQDVLRNLFAGFYLLIERPFSIGDFIEVGTVQGIIQSIELRLTVLATPDGCRVTVPNATVFTAIITNRSAQTLRSWPLLLTVPPSMTDWNALRHDIERVAAEVVPGAGAPSVRVRTASPKGSVVEIGLWAAEETAVSRAMLALRAALPDIEVSAPGAPAIPDNLPKATAPKKRITRTRQRPVARPSPRS